MKTAFPLVLGVSVLFSVGSGSAVSLSVHPDLQQFFGDQSVRLTCLDPLDPDGPVVKRVVAGRTQTCGAQFGDVSSSSCFLNEFQWFSGSYWCESRTREQSDSVSFLVSDRSLILDIPALPVAAGSDVTLRCRDRNRGPVAAYFFFNGSGPSNRERKVLHRIQQVQQADRGFYHCSTDELGSSYRGLLRVKDAPTTTPRTRTRSPSCVPPVHITLPPFSTIIFLPLTVLGALLVPLVLLVLVLVVMLWRRQRGQDRSSPAPDVTYAQVHFRRSTRTPSRRSAVGPVPALDCGYTECCDPSSG